MEEMSVFDGFLSHSNPGRNIGTINIWEGDYKKFSVFVAVLVD